MKNRDEILGKIRHLLSMTEKKGATEAEAVQAALMAQRLMAQYDVNEAELAVDEEEPITESWAWRPRMWHVYLALAIAENFRCKLYQSEKRKDGCKSRSKTVNFYGYQSDANAAKLVYERLRDLGTKLGNRYAKDRYEELRRQGDYWVTKGSILNTWADGFVKGVRDELEKQSVALMIVTPPKVTEEYEKMSAGFGRYNPRGRYARDNESRAAGRSSGRDAVRGGRIGANNTPALA